MNKLISNPENAISTKVKNLYSLTKSFNVPGWNFIGTDFYNRFIELTDLKNVIDNYMGRLNASNIKFISEELRKQVAFAEMPVELYEEITSIYAGGLVAVRVAFTKTHKNLNQMAFLNISGKDSLISAIKVLFSTKFLDAALELKLNEDFDFDVEIIIQDMLKPYSSGVVLSSNTFFDNSQVVVKSCIGLGTMISNNEITGDVYIVSDGEIINSVKAEQEYAYVLNRTGTKTEKINLGVNKKLPKLTDEQVLELAEMSKYIEGMFSCPQKISFAYVGRKLFLLSSEPIIESNKDLEESDELLIDEESKEDESVLQSDLEPVDKTQDIYSRIAEKYSVSVDIVRGILREFNDF